MLVDKDRAYRLFKKITGVDILGDLTVQIKTTVH